MKERPISIEVGCFITIIAVPMLIIGILAYNIGYRNGYEAGERDGYNKGWADRAVAKYVDVNRIGWDEIDESCPNEIHDYARDCIEERERTYQMPNITVNEKCRELWMNSTGYDYAGCYDVGEPYNKTVKELWDTCTGERIG